MDIKQLSEYVVRHRDMIYAAELSRLNGEPIYSQEELDQKVEVLLSSIASSTDAPTIPDY